MSDTTPITIPKNLLIRAYSAARRAYPKECCGWFAGSQGISQVSQHETCTNQDLRCDHFAMSNPDLVKFAFSFDSACPPKIVYHSHCNTSATFSQRDMSFGQTPWGPTYPVQHLVISIASHEVLEARLYAFCNTNREYRHVATHPGAKL